MISAAVWRRLEIEVRKVTLCSLARRTGMEHRQPHGGVGAFRERVRKPQMLGSPEC